MQDMLTALVIATEVISFLYFSFSFALYASSQVDADKAAQAQQASTTSTPACAEDNRSTQSETQVTTAAPKPVAADIGDRTAPTDDTQLTPGIEVQPIQKSDSTTTTENSNLLQSSSNDSVKQHASSETVEFDQTQHQVEPSFTSIANATQAINRRSKHANANRTNYTTRVNPSQTQLLRDRCKAANIQWRNAKGNNKHLTVKEMLAALNQ